MTKGATSLDACSKCVKPDIWPPNRPVPATMPTLQSYITSLSSFTPLALRPSPDRSTIVWHGADRTKSLRSYEAGGDLLIAVKTTAPLLSFVKLFAKPSENI